MFFAGDPFDGRRIYYPGGVSVTSDEQLDQELDRASTLGVDFFKTYVRLPDRLQKRIVDYAHEQGKPVTSHEIYPAVAFGIDGVEHLRGTSRRGYSPKVSGSSRAYKDVIDLLAKSGVTLTPTIGHPGRVSGARDRRQGAALRLAARAVPDAGGRDAGRPRARHRPTPRSTLAVKPYEAMVKAVAAGGGKIVAGTDSPIVPYGLGPARRARSVRARRA